MPKHTQHYSRNTLRAAFERAGLVCGDTVFSHSNIGFFGFPEEGRTQEIVCQTVFDALFDVIGSEGTLVVPTFTYSFCTKEVFDLLKTPSTCGAFTEFIRQKASAQRSADGIFSVAAIGKNARELTEAVPTHCFGKKSVWDRLMKRNAIICNMNFHAGSTFIHYVEKCLEVPYRFDKGFTGKIIQRGTETNAEFFHFCRDLDKPETNSDFENFDRLAKQRGFAKSVEVGLGGLVALRCQKAFSLISEAIEQDPWLLTKKAGGIHVTESPLSRDI